MSEPKGRRTEIDRVVARVSGGRSVVVTGDLGVGKTTLLKHVATELRAGETIVPAITATAAASGIPFGALAGFIDPTERAEPASQIAAATERLRRMGSGRPIVVFVDDAQHLDVASIAVLENLVRDGETVLMASVRASDPAPQELAELWRLAGADRIELGPLDDDATIELLAGALDPAVDPAVVADIARRSGGNPLFAGELAQAHRDGTSTGLTPQLVDLVGRRLDALASELQDQLTIVAIGQPLDVGLDIVDHDALARLEDAALAVTRDEEGAVVARAAHPLYGEVIRTRLTPLRRRDLSARLGTALASSTRRRRGDALRVVNWLLEAGDRPPAALAEAAAFEALGWLDADLAERLALMAIDAERNAGNLFALGEVRRVSGHPEDAARIWREAFELAEADDDIRRIGLALGQLHQLFLRDPDLAREILVEAAERITDASMRLGIESDIAMAQSTRDLRESVRAIDELLEDPDCGDESAWTALSNILWAKATLLDLDGVDRYFERATEIEGRLPADRDAEIDLIRALRINVELERGELVSAVETSHRWAEEAKERGIATGISSFSLGLVEVVRGDLAAAADAVDDALNQFRGYDAFNATPMTLSLRSIVAAATGEVDAAQAFLAEAVRRGGDDAPWMAVWQPKAVAWTAAATGEHGVACQAAMEAGKSGLDGFDIGWGVLALHDVVGWGCADEVVGTMERVRGHVKGCDLFEIVFDHARAAADGSPGALANCARRFEACGAGTFAAAAWANRSGVVGDAVEACRDATRAVCLGPATVLMPGTTDRALTARQLDVALRGATGATSKSIADELFVSARTVDNHLREVYRRLGISRRSELAEVVAPVSMP